ncbi:MAG: hypothetical protein ACKPGB_27950, partial [Dolichospermum sp.]
FEAFERLKSQGTEEERTAINTKLEEIHKLLLEYQQKSSNELITVYSEFNISNEIELAQSQVKGKKFSEEMKKCARIYPQDNNTEGFFVCKLKKLSNKISSREENQETEEDE